MASKAMHLPSEITDSMIQVSNADSRPHEKIPDFDVCSGAGLLKAVPYKSYVHSGVIVQRLKDTLRELDDCKTEADVERVSALIKSLLANQFGVSERGSILQAMSKACRRLKNSGQTLKSKRISKLHKILLKLPTQTQKKQRKMLREILRLSAQIQGTSIPKRGLCNRCRSNWMCHAACLTGIAFTVGGAIVVCALAAIGTFDEVVDAAEQLGEDNDQVDPEEEERLRLEEEERLRLEEEDRIMRNSLISQETEITLENDEEDQIINNEVVPEENVTPPKPPTLQEKQVAAINGNKLFANLPESVILEAIADLGLSEIELKENDVNVSLIVKQIEDTILFSNDETSKTKANVIYNMIVRDLLDNSEAEETAVLSNSESTPVNIDIMEFDKETAVLDLEEGINALEAGRNTTYGSIYGDINMIQTNEDNPKIMLKGHLTEYLLMKHEMQNEFEEMDNVRFEDYMRNNTFEERTNWADFGTQQLEDIFDDISDMKQFQDMGKAERYEFAMYYLEASDIFGIGNPATGIRYAKSELYVAIKDLMDNEQLFPRMRISNFLSITDHLEVNKPRVANLVTEYIRGMIRNARYKRYIDTIVVIMEHEMQVLGEENIYNSLRDFDTLYHRGEREALRAGVFKRTPLARLWSMSNEYEKSYYNYEGSRDEDAFKLAADHMRTLFEKLKELSSKYSASDDLSYFEEEILRRTALRNTMTEVMGDPNVNPYTRAKAFVYRLGVRQYYEDQEKFLDQHMARRFKYYGKPDFHDDSFDKHLNALLRGYVERNDQWNDTDGEINTAFMNLPESFETQATGEEVETAVLRFLQITNSSLYASEEHTIYIQSLIEYPGFDGWGAAQFQTTKFQEECFNIIEDVVSKRSLGDIHYNDKLLTPEEMQDFRIQWIDAKFESPAIRMENRVANFRAIIEKDILGGNIYLKETYFKVDNTKLIKLAIKHGDGIIEKLRIFQVIADERFDLKITGKKTISFEEIKTTIEKLPTTWPNGIWSNHDKPIETTKDMEFITIVLKVLTRLSDDPVEAQDAPRNQLIERIYSELKTKLPNATFGRRNNKIAPETLIDEIAGKLRA